MLLRLNKRLISEGETLHEEMALMKGGYRAAEGGRDGSNSLEMRILLRKSLPEVHPALRTRSFPL